MSSRHLHDAVREGDVLNVSAPAGRFTFRPTESQSIVMIAGGVGITPKCRLPSAAETTTSPATASTVM